MKRAVSIKSKFFLIAAVVAGIAAPVSAALWQSPDANPIATATPQDLNLARFDGINRIGSAQISSDPYCDFSPLVAANLRETYGETLQASLTHEQGSWLDIWASEVPGTWTAVYTRADGVACVVGSGVDWTDERSTDAVLAGLSKTL